MALGGSRLFYAQESIKKINKSPALGKLIERIFDPRDYLEPKNL